MSANPKKTYAIGDTVKIWITAETGRYEAEVLRLDEKGHPDRLRVTACPADQYLVTWQKFTLKPGDFGIREES